MFSPQVFWRIDNLIKTLTKKNNKTHTAELAELTKMYDTSSKAFLISSLLEEIDFRDLRTTGHKDTQKVHSELPLFASNIFFIELTSRKFNSYHYFMNHLQINALQDIVAKGLTEPNFASYLCQAFESYSNEKRLPQQPKIHDDIINIMCKTLKLSTIQTVAVGFALIDWNYADSRKFLRLKLPEVLAGTTLGEVNDDLIHGLFLLISSSEVCYN